MTQMVQFLSFLRLNDVSLHVYATFSLSIYLKMDIFCFLVLVIVNSAAVNMVMQISLHDPDFSSSWYILPGGVLGCGGLRDWGNPLPAQPHRIAGLEPNEICLKPPGGPGLCARQGLGAHLHHHPRPRSPADPWKAQGRGRHSGPCVILDKQSFSASRGTDDPGGGTWRRRPSQSCSVCVLERVVLRLLRIWAPSSFIRSVQSLRANVSEGR